MSQGSALRALVARFHSRRPIRTWSLIVSVFGVVGLPARRALKLTDLQDWLAACGVEAGLVRTALSRLVAGGMLLRERDGKTALYRLSPSAETEFGEAARLIYGPARPRPTGWLELALIENGQSRQDARTQLAHQGFVQLTRDSLIRPEHEGRPPALDHGQIVLRSAINAQIASRVRTIWPIDELDGGYKQFSVLAEGLVAEISQLGRQDISLARILLVHEFRRIVLRDPFLPTGLLPVDWQGEAVRALFDQVMAVLVEAEKAAADMDMSHPDL